MTRVVKCVVWDLDNTLWPGIAIEAEPDDFRQPNTAILDIITELEKHGIASSVASRNDPALGEQLLAHPLLAGKFVYPQVSWEPKSQAIRRIAEKLNIGLDAVAFVDDSPFERAEVSYMFPQGDARGETVEPPPRQRRLIGSRVQAGAGAGCRPLTGNAVAVA